MNGDGIEWFSNITDILNHLKKKLSRPRETLSALFVLTKKQSYKDIDDDSDEICK
jgi:hypothetical protein